MAGDLIANVKANALALPTAPAALPHMVFSPPGAMLRSSHRRRL